MDGAIAKPVSDLFAWHAVAADEVLRRLNTDPRKGLDTGELTQRLSKYGANRLPEGKKQGPFTRFLLQFNNILVYVLLGAGFVKLMLGLWLDAAIILAVAFEPHELDVMNRRPRAVGRAILTAFGIWRVIFVGLALLTFTLWAFFRMKSQGAPDSLARTVAVNAIVIGQIFYLLNSRYLLDSSLSIKAHLENKYLPLGVGAVVVLQLLFTYGPPLQVLFDNEAIPFHVWPWLILGGLVFFLVVEVEKLIIRSAGPLRSAVTAVEAGT